MRKTHVTVNVRLDATALIAAIDDAREQVVAAVRRLALACNLRAAEILRAEWPTAAVLEADLTRHVEGEGSPDVLRVLDAAGTTLFDGREIAHEVVDEAVEYLTQALTFADPELAGWDVLRSGADSDSDDEADDDSGELYKLTLPEGLDDVA